MEATSAGITAAIIFGYVAAVLFNPKGEQWITSQGQSHDGKPTETDRPPLKKTASHFLGLYPLETAAADPLPLSVLLKPPRHHRLEGERVRCWRAIRVY